MNKIYPKNWTNFNLKDICFFQEGPGLRNWQYKETGIKFINIRCIKDEYLDLSNAQYISKDEVELKYKHFLLNEGDYVLSSSGTIGRIAVVREYDLPLLLNTSVIRFRSLDQSKLDKNFLFYFLQSNQFFEKIYEQSQGSAQVNFGPTHLNLIKGNFPPLSEQKKIVEILSGIDKLQKSYEKLKNKLLNFKKSLFENIFNPNEVLKNNYFKNGKFSDLVILKRGFDLPVQERTKGKIPIYGSNGIIFYHNKSTQNSPGIVTGRSGSIGRVYFSEEPFWALNTTLYSEKTFNNDIKYIYYFLQWFNLEKFSTGTGVPTLNRNNLHSQKILIPSISYQRNSSSILTNLDNEIFKLEQKISKIKILYKGISSDLLSGSKRIKV